MVCVLRRTHRLHRHARDPVLHRTHDVTLRPVLVLSTDDLAGALLAALAESAGLSPVFADASETPRDALRRLRPALVLVDCEHETACTEQFLGPVRMMGATALVFGRGADAEKLRGVADQHRVRVFTLPIDADELNRTIRDALNGG